MPILVNILVVLVVLLLFLAALLVFRAMMYGRAPTSVAPLQEDVVAVDAQRVADHLAAALRVQTISEQDRSKIDLQAFADFHALLERMYPGVHAALKRETINEWSLLYTWMGRNLDLEPVLLMGHIDVVPVDPATRDEWTRKPFGGEIDDGYVWGRGALDMKSTVITIFEAVEGLLRTGYQPERTLYLAFGHDEEIGGTQGASAIAALLESRGVRLMAVLDEGGAIFEGMLPGVEVPMGLVGVAEKGYATLVLRAEGRGGHSATPPPHTAIGVLSRAITRLENNPMPARLSMARLMLDELGIFLPMKQRLALANSWLFSGLIRKQMGASPVTNAMIRTTTAVTVMHGGVKDNILPSQAESQVNFRILPGDRVADVMARARQVVDDVAVQIHLPDFSSWEPSPVSPADSPVFQDLSETIREIFPDVAVAPFLVIGATDSRYYARICACVYRFSPYRMTNDEVHLVHGSNERIAVEALPRMVQFYARLVDEWTGS